VEIGSTEKHKNRVTPPSGGFVTLSPLYREIALFYVEPVVSAREPAKYDTRRVSVFSAEMRHLLIAIVVRRHRLPPIALLHKISVGYSPPQRAVSLFQVSISVVVHHQPPFFL